MDGLTIDPRTGGLDQPTDRGIEAHGRLRPFLVAGIRFGPRVSDVVDGVDCFGLRVEPNAGLIIPLSCLSVGIQIGSERTGEEGDPILTDLREPSATFAAENGHSVEMAICEETSEGFRSRGTDHDAGDWTKREPPEALFAWKPPSSG